MVPCFSAHTVTIEEQLLQDQIDQTLVKLNRRLQDIDDQDLLDLETAAAKLYFEIHKRRLELHK